MVRILVMLIVLLPLFGNGQEKAKESQGAINYNDIIEINSLIYFKADTTLVTGKVVRYNKKNIPKKYFLVSNGKPDNFGWVYFNDKVDMPKESLLGEALKTSAFITGVAMVVTGNDINLPIGDSNRHLNPIRNHISEQNKSVTKAYNDMAERNEISSVLDPVKEKPNKELEEGNKEGQIQINRNYIEEKKNGIWEEYYNNGQLSIKGNYNDGEKDGLWEAFYENSQLMSTLKYVSGKKDGLYKEYYSNGQLTSIGSYKNGRVTGEWKFYDVNGKLLLTENY